MSRKRGRWQKIKWALVIAAGAAIFLLLVPPGVAVYIQEKTVWDIWELLIIPVCLAIGAALFAWIEQKSEREIADNNQQENALQAYLDKMTELILERGLQPSECESSDKSGYGLVRDVARART